MKDVPRLQALGPLQEGKGREPYTPALNRLFIVLAGCKSTATLQTLCPVEKQLSTICAGCRQLMCMHTACCCGSFGVRGTHGKALHMCRSSMQLLSRASAWSSLKLLARHLVMPTSPIAAWLLLPMIGPGTMLYRWMYGNNVLFYAAQSSPPRSPNNLVQLSVHVLIAVFSIPAYAVLRRWAPSWGALRQELPLRLTICRPQSYLSAPHWGVLAAASPYQSWGGLH